MLLYELFFWCDEGHRVQGPWLQVITWLLCKVIWENTSTHYAQESKSLNFSLEKTPLGLLVKKDPWMSWLDRIHFSMIRNPGAQRPLHPWTRGTWPFLELAADLSIVHICYFFWYSTCSSDELMKISLQITMEGHSGQATSGECMKLYK